MSERYPNTYFIGIAFVDLTQDFHMAAARRVNVLTITKHPLLMPFQTFENPLE